MKFGGEFQISEKRHQKSIKWVPPAKIGGE